jgi:hypothetical protein
VKRSKKNTCHRDRLGKTKATTFEAAVLTKGTQRTVHQENKSFISNTTKEKMGRHKHNI